jgi:hypothetical protein
MGFFEKIKEIFAEDESWKTKEPIRYKDKVFGAWVPEEDKRAAWPNGLCAKCNGIMLKKDMYWNKETDTWYHPDCLKELTG